MINTYMFSNMCPQYDSFNVVSGQGWNHGSENGKETKGEVYVITGAVFDKDGDGSRDADSDADRMRTDKSNAQVAVPTHFYKIMLHERPTLAARYFKSGKARKRHCIRFVAGRELFQDIIKHRFYIVCHVHTSKNALLTT